MISKLVMSSKNASIYQLRIVDKDLATKILLLHIVALTLREKEIVQREQNER
jgi:hypothetical protein